MTDRTEYYKEYYIKNQEQRKERMREYMKEYNKRNKDNINERKRDKRREAKKLEEKPHGNTSPKPTKMKGYKIIKKLIDADYPIGFVLIEGMQSTPMYFNKDGEQYWRYVGYVELGKYVQDGYMVEVEVDATPTEE